VQRQWRLHAFLAGPSFKADLTTDGGLGSKVSADFTRFSYESMGSFPRGEICRKQALSASRHAACIRHFVFVGAQKPSVLVCCARFLTVAIGLTALDVPKCTRSLNVEFPSTVLRTSHDL